MLWDMHLCVFDVRLSFENRVTLRALDTQPYMFVVYAFVVLSA